MGVPNALRRFEAVYDIGDGGTSLMEAKMPGDPQKWSGTRTEVQVTFGTADLKKMFFDLAQSWSRLAAELDDTNTFLRALNQMEFEDVLLR
jgi:hypothetical protein